MEAIKETIASVMCGWQAKTKGAAPSDPYRALKKALTKKEAGHIKVNYFKKGILCVSVDSSGWLYNLGLQKEALLGKLKKDLNGLKDIRFYIGEIK